jgi:phosphoglycerate dehydrogenase-like enzyme
LIKALRTRRIAVAGLDVYNGEPHLRKEYAALPKIFPLPHVGSTTVETRIKMGTRALDNLDPTFAGKNPSRSGYAAWRRALTQGHALQLERCVIGCMGLGMKANLV